MHSAQQRLRTARQRHGSAWHAPASHHCYRFAPTPAQPDEDLSSGLGRVREPSRRSPGGGPPAYRRLFLHVLAGGGCAGAAAAQSTVPQPGARRTSTRPKHNHPTAVKALLNKWFAANYDHPFPDVRGKAALAARTGERLLTSCVVRLAAAWRAAEFNLDFRTECRASRLMVCECAQTRVEACDAPEGSASCKATTSQGRSSAASRTTSWHHLAFRCCRRLRPVRTRHCATSTRDSCGASGLEWPVFRTASGCAADELPYSRSCAGALCAFADVPALFELRAVGRAGGAAAAAFPRVPAP